jgi:hypothetical protein
MIVNDDSSVISKQRYKLIDNARVIIYDRNVFKIQATDGVKNSQLKYLLLVG